MGKRILIVEDEQHIVDILKFNLEREGFEVIVAYDGEKAVEMTFSQNPDLILLDIMLPRLDGISVCIKIREKLTTPIIMLTARTEEIDKRVGFELGADEYVYKPFSIRNLTTRIKEILESQDSELTHKLPRKTLTSEGLLIDLDQYKIKRDGKILDFSFEEFELVKLLADNHGIVVSKEIILAKVWGNVYFGNEKLVDKTVDGIKMKLEKDPQNPEYIMTKDGEGYYLNKSE